VDEDQRRTPFTRLFGEDLQLAEPNGVTLAAHGMTSVARMFWRSM
jgi:hypothetical protein